MLNSILKVRDLWSSGVLGTALFSNKPRSIASHLVVAQLRQIVPELKIIIDGGANHGQFSRACSNLYPKTRIIAFEPLPHVFKDLTNNLKDNPNFTAVQSALGAEDGDKVFREFSNDQCSSFLNRETHSELLGDSRVIAEHTVPIKRLDTFLSQIKMVQPSLLKLDLQGYEDQAIIGAGECIQHFSHILVECILTPAYTGELTFDGLWSLIKKSGFELSGVLNVARRSGRIVQVDALFSSRNVSST